MTYQTDQRSTLFWGKSRRFADAIWLGAMLIWVGLVFLADGVGYLPRGGSGDAWSWAFLGAGTFALALNTWRLLAPDVSPPTAWDYTLTFLFLILGIGIFVNFAFAWELIAIGVGAVILVGTMVQGDTE